jgi:hypothetical protein
MLKHSLFCALFVVERAMRSLMHRFGFPRIVCLCGSTARALSAFREANLQETIAGRIVLSIGCDTHSDTDLFGMAPEQMAHIKARLDWLHKRKIDLADEVLILNVGGYIGASTAGELAYAQFRGKRIRYWEPPAQKEVQP